MAKIRKVKHQIRNFKAIYNEVSNQDIKTDKAIQSHFNQFKKVGK